MSIAMAIEEIAISGEVCVKKCSTSTLYRWCRAINERLEKGKYEWRVKANKSAMTIRKED